VPNGSHTLLALARDAAGNVTTSSPITVTVANTQTVGLTAGYAFDETSGTTAADATSHAIVGTLINGPTFATGKYGNAISLDGVNDYVSLGNPAELQLTGSMTLSAWVNASSFPVDDAAVVSKRSGEIGFQLDVTKDTGPRTIGFKLTNSSGGPMFRYGATTLQPGNWYHIAGVYDAATQSLHVYLNGQLDDGVLQGTVTASQQDSSANVTIGRRSGNAGFEFAGRVDDTRVYERALTAAEIQADMLTSLGAPDTVAPSAPTDLSASVVSSSQIDLSWTASTDNIAVTGYRVFRDGTEIGTASTTSFSDTGLTADTAYEYTVGAIDAAGNPSDLSATVNATTPAPDTVAPSVVLTGPAAEATVSGTVTITADAADDVGVAGVQFLVDGVNLGAEDGASPYSVSWNTAGVPNGSHTLLALARDAAGNVTTSSPITVTVANTQTAGLVAGWSFDEASGTLATDRSGNNNTATLVNGVARGTGNYGGGLTFDGINDYLSIPNSASLDVSGTELTLSMWINPQALAGGDSVVLGKFWNATMTSPYYQYGLELSGGTVPVFQVGTTGGVQLASMGSALALNQWSNLAIVFNGSQAQFYVNGALVTTASLSASITARGNALRVGADASTQQFFKGSLDDVRIYTRALTTAEIQADMATPL
jgi:hypothetical protein